MIEQIKLPALTTVLTLLIWVTANSLVIESASLSVAFEVLPDAGSPDMLVSIDATAISYPPAGTYVVEFTGPRKELEQLKEDLLKIALRIPDRPTGAVDAPIRPLLHEQWDRFPTVSIVSVRPATLPLLVDHLVEIAVPVEPRALRLSYDVAPRLHPKQVHATLRERDLRDLEELEVRIRHELDVEPHLRDKPEGRSVTIDISLGSTLLGKSVTFSPSTVQVTATTKGRMKTAKIGPVPIRADVSFELFGRPYRPVGPDGTILLTQSITVIGPVEDVERLERNETGARGLIRIREADFDRPDTIRSVRPDFYLPPRIELAEPAEAIEYKLIPMTPADGRD